MEESAESSKNREINTVLTSSSFSSSEEESGWTLYFEEFIASQKKEQQEQNTSSRVSDAASRATGKATLKEGPSLSCKRLIFKKRKAMGISFTDDEDPLEDTATSPVNSPKVGGIDVHHLDVNNGKKGDIRCISEVNEDKGFGFEKCAELKGDVVNELSVVDGTSELTELKKRGLCLVPLTMFVDFLEH